MAYGYVTFAILTHGVLLLAFGLGVLRAACRKRVWWIGALLVAIGVLGLPTHTVWGDEFARHGDRVQ